MALEIETPLPVLPVERPKSILVVGGGVAGLVTLRNLTKPDEAGTSAAFDNVQLWERRDQIGGVWSVSLAQNLLNVQSTY